VTPGAIRTPRSAGRCSSDRYRDKIEELVERSGGRVRADIVHERLRALDPEHPYPASERTTRRAVRRAKAAYRAGRRRTYRPWVTEPGMWLQFDWGAGPAIGGGDGIDRISGR